VLNVIREALAQLPHLHAAIFLNPEDASLARSYLGDQLTHAGHRIHEDPKLARGDCVLEAGGSHIDATVATRWRRTLEGLGLGDAWQARDDEQR
jgi:flagellar assembly protein FliH